MTIRFRCSAGHKLTVSDDLAGRKVRCPTCQAKVVAPAASQEDGATQLDEPPVASPPVAAPPVGQPQPATPTNHTVQIRNDASPATPTSKAALPFPDAAANDTQKRVQGTDGKRIKSTSNQKRTAQKQKKQPNAKQQAPSSSVVPLPEEAPTNNSKAENNADASARTSVPFPEAATSTAATSGTRSQVAVAITADGEFEPDTGRLQTTYLLAIAMAAVSLLAAAPALPHLGIIGAPVWALALLVLLLAHILYVVWAVSLPDWSTVWIGGVLFIATSIAYGGGAILAGIGLAWLGLPEARGAAVGWTATMAALFAIVAYGCWRFASDWRRDFELGQSSGDE